MSYNCEILADSISPQGHRLTTFKVTYPRIIHAEMCRHRILSRNTASSRAIPFEKMVKDVQENPFIPIAWQKDHKGMQGTEYFNSKWDIRQRNNNWIHARDAAISTANLLHKSNGVTKQLCNRLLEPFVWTTELVSGTEWENFFSLRCPKYHTPVSGEGFYFRSKKDFMANHSNPENLSKLENMTDLEWLQINDSQAEIHIQKMAEMMWDCYNQSKPKTLQSGQWHIPYGDNIAVEDCFKAQPYSNKSDNGFDYYNEVAVKIATARAARISYTTLGDNPKIDYEADIKLHDRLLESKHLSCFEHCSRAMSEGEYESFYKGGGANKGHTGLDENKGRCNNYRGFIQYRYLIENQ